jgi:hypothetical protein
MSIDFEALKGKVMDLTQTGMAKAKELTDTGVSKAKELTEMSKLKVQNANEQDTIRKAYLELGKLYYAERGAAPEAGYAEQCLKISEAKAKIDYNNQRIADIKSAGNLTDEDEAAAEAEAEATVEDAPADDVPPQE